MSVFFFALKMKEVFHHSGLSYKKANYKKEEIPRGYHLALGSIERERRIQMKVSSSVKPICEKCLVNLEERTVSTDEGFQMCWECPVCHKQRNRTPTSELEIVLIFS